MEGVGGEAAARLLDSLSRLNGEEQAIVIKVFGAVIDRIVQGERRLVSADDLEQKALVESLCNDILSGFEGGAFEGTSAVSNDPASSAHTVRAPRLAIVDGGKEKRDAAPIDFVKARAARKTLKNPFVN